MCLSYKATLKRFMLELEKKGLCLASRKKYRIVFNKLKGINLDKLNKKTCERVFFILKSANELNDESKSSYWFRFRIFVKWLRPKIDISGYRFSAKKKRKLPEEILSIDEVRKLIQFAKNNRDKVMLSLLYDSGCRPAELLNLKPADIIYDDNGLIVTFNGKTGMRRIRIITSLESDKLLKEYLDTAGREVEPGSNPQRVIFPISPERLEHIVKEYSKKANLTKRVIPYIFRHSRATHLASYLNEQQMKVYFGWAMDSRMVAVYVHLSGRDLDEKVYELNHKDFIPINTLQSDDFKQFLLEQFKAWKNQTIINQKKEVLA